MNTELRDRWIAALASGEFTQTQGVLWREEANPNHEPQRAGHCCLGVLCVITDTPIPNGQGMLPESLAELTGLDADIEVEDSNGDPMDQSLQEYLADMNDNHDDNFASVIEAIKERVPSE